MGRVGEDGHRSSLLWHEVGRRSLAKRSALPWNVCFLDKGSFQDEPQGWKKPLVGLGAHRFALDRFVPLAEERAALEALGVVRIPLPIPFPMEPVNVTLLLGDPPALVDTGIRYQNALPLLDRALQTHGLDLSAIGEIWLTHPHLDHFGLAGELAERTGARVMGWQGGRSRFEQYLDHWTSDREAYVAFLEEAGVEEELRENARNAPTHYHEMAGPVRLDRTVAAQEGVWMAGRHRATLLHLPGHSPWCTAYWLEEEGLLLGGDVVLERIPSNPLFYPPGTTPASWQGLDAYCRSLQRLHDLPVRRLLPGHGASFVEHRAVILRHLGRLEQRQGRCREVLQRGPATVYELAQAVFSPELTRRALFLIMSETLRQLQWLEALGEVVSEREDGLRRYVLLPGA